MTFTFKKEKKITVCVFIIDFDTVYKRMFLVFGLKIYLFKKINLEWLRAKIQGMAPIESSFRLVNKIKKRKKKILNKKEYIVF
jgi:hypothetical protein